MKWLPLVSTIECRRRQGNKEVPGVTKARLNTNNGHRRRNRLVIRAARTSSTSQPPRPIEVFRSADLRKHWLNVRTTLGETRLVAERNCLKVVRRRHEEDSASCALPKIVTRPRENEARRRSDVVHPEPAMNIPPRMVKHPDPAHVRVSHRRPPPAELRPPPEEAAWPVRRHGEPHD